MIQTNVQGTENLLNACIAEGAVNYFCYVSSVGVMGRVPAGKITEDWVCRPINLYESTKYDAEKLVRLAGLKAKVKIIRPTNVLSIKKPGIIASVNSNKLLDRVKVILRGSECAHIVHAIDVARASVFLHDKCKSDIETYIVSRDLAPCSTLSELNFLLRKDRAFTRLLRIPPCVPYTARKLLRGTSSHGEAKYSDAKLTSLGFSYKYSPEAILSEIASGSLGVRQKTRTHRD